MSLARFAGDIWGAMGGKKRNVVMGGINSSGEGVLSPSNIVGTLRTVGSQIHPLAGAVDDIASVGEKLQGINTGPTIHDVGENIVGGIQAGLSSVGGVGSLLGGKGMAAAAGIAAPASAILGTSMLISKPAVEAMRDPKVRNADIDAYREAFGR